MPPDPTVPQPADPNPVDSLYRISQLVDRAHSAHEALEAVVDELIRVLPANYAAIELLDHNTGILEVEAK